MHDPNMIMPIYTEYDYIRFVLDNNESTDAHSR